MKSQGKGNLDSLYLRQRVYREREYRIKKGTKIEWGQRGSRRINRQVRDGR